MVFLEWMRGEVEMHGESTRPIDSGLFIGGPWDGRRQIVEGHRYTVLTRRLDSLEARAVDYQRVNIDGFLIWAVEGIDPKEILPLLITRYRPEVTP